MNGNGAEHAQRWQFQLRTLMWFVTMTAIVSVVARGLVRDPFLLRMFLFYLCVLAAYGLICGPAVWLQWSRTRRRLAAISAVRQRLLTEMESPSKLPGGKTAPLHEPSDGRHPAVRSC